MHVTKKINYDDRGIEVFRHFIGFLTVWGQENYGESVEIDWSKAYRECVSFGLLDFNEALEEVIYQESDEGYRDACYKWIENQVLKGFPIWRLFKISDWLSNCYEKELNEIEQQKDLEAFNKNKCYKCKHFVDKVTYIGSDKFSHPISDPSWLTPDSKLLHLMSCNKRIELSSKNGKSHFFSSHESFEYHKFDVDDDTQLGYGSRWHLIPSVLNDCPYFDEDKEMTFERFLETYREIIRE